VSVTPDIPTWAVRGEDIECLESLGADEFEERARVGRPFIVRNAAANSRAVTTWSREYLSARLGGIEVHVYVSIDGSFAGGLGPWDESKKRVVMMTFGELVDRLHEPERFTPILGRGEKYYGYQTPADFYAPVQQDLERPRFCPEAAGNAPPSVWVSSAGTMTPPHTDGAIDNLFLQVVGRKRFLLWDPSQAPLLYIRPFGVVHSRQCAFDVCNVDVDAFPKLREARASVGELGAGDALFIPKGWLHFVITDTFSVSASFPCAELERLHAALVELSEALLATPDPLRGLYLHLLGWQESVPIDTRRYKPPT
jgi:hypothetical protein